MNRSGKNSNREYRAAKRARFAAKGEKPAGPSPWVLVLGIALVTSLIAGAAIAISRRSPQTTSPQLATSDLGTSNTLVGSEALSGAAATLGHQPYPLVVAEDGEVTLPLASFDDRMAHHYMYMHVEQPIEFFVLKSEDGVVRAAFNACDVCFSARLGYTQDGDHMVCNNCGRRFPSDQINVLQGGCNPSPLRRAVEGQDLVIQVDDLVGGLAYF